LAGGSIPEPRLPRSLLAIVNPRAGNAAALVRLRDTLRAAERRGWSVDARGTLWPGHAREMAAWAAAEGCAAVLVCGGDGTINEVVNGLAGSATALAVLPRGTVNIWAREMRLPFDAERAIALLDEGERRRVDLGRAGERYFLLLASAGIDSAAVRAVSTASTRWKRESYLLAALRDAVRHGGRAMELRIEGAEGEERIAGRVLIAVIGNTRLYGGVLRIAARARVDDGLLDLCAYEGEGLRDLARHALRTFRREHIGAPGVVYRQATRIVLTTPEPVPVEADGEHMGYTPLPFAAVPHALTVIVPRGVRSPLFSTPATPDGSAGA
jgi:diacylglycerol kinase (ATP)